jgi:hypothetical protein
MLRISKFFAPLALAAGIAGAIAAAGAADVSGQPPFGKGPFGKGQPPFGKGFPDKGDDKKGDDKKDGKKVEEKKADVKKGEEKKGPGPKSDATVDAWLKVLLEKITDPHDTVRDSARGAVVAVGPPALPALQALADGNDPAKAVAARKLIAAIQGGRGPRDGPQGPAPTTGQPGRPGFGFGPPNFPGVGPMGRPGGSDRGPEPKRDFEPKRGGREGGFEVAPMPRAK